ncbi:MAG: hypothetical protein ACNS62_19075 [Candidatus Cyclobacteriaceae bacterium M3_2C_046]
MSEREFMRLPFKNKIKILYEDGTYVMSIRYYSHKVNLYLLNNFYIEVFYNHKKDKIDKIAPLERTHTRMKFYSDQISLPKNLFSRS